MDLVGKRSRRMQPAGAGFLVTRYHIYAGEVCARLIELDHAHAAPLMRGNLLVPPVDRVVELLVPFSVAAVLAPLARSRQEAVLAWLKHSIVTNVSFLGLLLPALGDELPARGHQKSDVLQTGHATRLPLLVSTGSRWSGRTTPFMFPQQLIRCLVGAIPFVDLPR